MISIEKNILLVCLLTACSLSFIVPFSSFAQESQTFILDSDWSNGNYESADGITPEAEAGLLLLESDPGSMVFAFDPTPNDAPDPIRAIAAAVEHRDKL